MTRNLGTYNTSSTRTHVRFQFSTHAAAGGNVAPSSAFEAVDLRLYRANDGAAFSVTQRSSAAGITMTSPFDSLVGVHDVDIDLTDDTDAGFYAAGYRYSVVLAPDETVDGQTITGAVLAEFEIGPAQADVRQWIGTAVATPTTAGVPEVDATFIDGVSSNKLAAHIPAVLKGLTTSGGSTTTVVFNATTGIDGGVPSATDDFYNGRVIVFTSGALAGQATSISDYVGSTQTATVVAMTGTPASGVTCVIV